MYGQTFHEAHNLALHSTSNAFFFQVITLLFLYRVSVIDANQPCDAMASTAEFVRQQHEDIETLKQLAAKALQSRSDPTSPHPRIQALPNPLTSTMEAEQLVAYLISSAQNRAKNLLSLYSSHQDLLVSHMGDNAHDDPFPMFYAALRELRDVHRLNEPQTLDQQSFSAAERDLALLAPFKPALFSDEEGAGRFLDLQTFFRQYLNFSSNRSLLYYQYVRDKLTLEFDDDIPLSVRWGRRYEDYLSSLLNYLRDFATRAHPLDRIDCHIATATENARRQILSELNLLRENNSSPEMLLQSVGHDQIKKILARLGLKSGGKPSEKAKRLWDAADQQLFGKSVLYNKVIAFLAGDLLVEEKNATVVRIENKLGLSYQEIEAERKAAETVTQNGNRVGEDDVTEVESTIYNPKDVPLGWDGKPIPYWMYKLHGLNHEFKCEICGGATYKGPRAFERHFTDSTHVSGLRRLGIGYSKSFMMITRIQDAVNLQQRLHGNQSELEFDKDREVEVEDSHGNVMNLKTMNDLKRQGLL